MDAAASRWPDLPSDLLSDISARLPNPVDFVHFHTTCKPWRDTAPLSHHRSFLPWLLTPRGSRRNPGPLFRSIFSNTAWRAYRVSSSQRWLACADGTGMWMLSPDGEAPCLVNPLTGAVTARLPRLPDKIANFIQTPNIDSAPRRSIFLPAEKPSRQFGHHYFKINVGNLPWEVDSSRLRQFFNIHGHVADATVIYDTKTRSRSRGFGFVIMATMEEPAVAIAALNGQILDGRALSVSLCRGDTAAGGALRAMAY